MVTDGCDSHEVIDKSVHLIRVSARNLKDWEAIGGQCSTIMLPADPTGNVEISYFTEKPSKIFYGVALVNLFSGEIRSAVETGRRDEDGQDLYVAGPRLSRNQRCWCHSGKRYKDCHGLRARQARRKRRRGP